MHSFVACLSQLTVDPASLSRRSTVSYSKSGLGALAHCVVSIYSTFSFRLDFVFPFPISPPVATTCIQGGGDSYKGSDPRRVGCVRDLARE